MPSSDSAALSAKLPRREEEEEGRDSERDKGQNSQSTYISISPTTETII
jgi:hypothetical protein